MQNEESMKEQLQKIDNRLSAFEDKVDRSIDKISDTLHEMSLVLSAQSSYKETFDRVFNEIEKSENKILDIDKQMPVLQLMASVVKITALAILALFGTGLGTIVWHFK